MTNEANDKGASLIKRSEVIHALLGQKLEEIGECSDPHMAEIFLKGWNQAVGDCVEAIEKL